MQAGLINEQRYWMSPEGNAIWFGTGSTAGRCWFLGSSDDVGSEDVFIYVPINDPSKDCPHDLQSHWFYANENAFLEDFNNHIQVYCLKGTLQIFLSLDQCQIVYFPFCM